MEVKLGMKFFHKDDCETVYEITSISEGLTKNVIITDQRGKRYTVYTVKDIEDFFDPKRDFGYILIGEQPLPKDIYAIC